MKLTFKTDDGYTLTWEHHSTNPYSGLAIGMWVDDDLFFDGTPDGPVDSDGEPLTGKLTYS